jgi:hypothetical protein
VRRLSDHRSESPYTDRPGIGHIGGSGSDSVVAGTQRRRIVSEPGPAIDTKQPHTVGSDRRE